MKAHWYPTDDLPSFEQQLMSLAQDGRVRTILVFACDQNGWLKADLDPVLQAIDKPVLGGVFPQVIHEGVSHEKGCLVVALPFAVKHGLITGLSDPDADYDQQLMEQMETLIDTTVSQQSLMVWVDGLSSRIGSLIESIFYTLGLSFNLFGGGAGSLSFEQKPCLFDNNGMVMDAALIISLPIATAMGVSHGWQAVSEPLQVTSAEANTVKTLNWRPAFDVYKELVDSMTGQSLTPEAFFDTAKAYPFGLSRIGSEIVVRDPLKVTQEGHMLCVGEVPEGSFVKILHGTHQSLIAAAAETKALALENQKHDDQIQLAFLVNCISRVLFHGEHLSEELAAVLMDQPSIGVMTLGEIANNGEDFIEFYNKTMVMALMMRYQES